ncbi:MAG: hypothetical protein IJT70_02790 [Clostridia bacterium]|nr:hypothetical protein [Clostridia bacterium]
MKSLSYILLFVLIISSAFCAASCTFKEDADTPPQDPDGTLSGCLFIGDSRTYGLEMTNSLPDAEYFCYTGWTVYHALSETLYVDGEYYTLSELLSSRDYRKIYVLLGINEISYDLDAVTEKFSELISLIRSCQPDAKIIIQANLHVTTARSSLGDAYNNNNVDLLNQKLYGLTDDKTVFWLDANQILDDSSGGLREEYAEEDGIHPNADCYSIWGEWITSQNRMY